MTKAEGARMRAMETAKKREFLAVAAMQDLSDDLKRIKRLRMHTTNVETNIAACNVAAATAHSRT